MIKWEYMIVVQNNLTVDELNEFGQQGWEMVQFLNNCFIFKRQAGQKE